MRIYPHTCFCLLNLQNVENIANRKSSKCDGEIVNALKTEVRIDFRVIQHYEML